MYTAVAVTVAVSASVSVSVGVVASVMAGMQMHGDCASLDIALRVFTGPVKGDAYGLSWRGIP